MKIKFYKPIIFIVAIIYWAFCSQYHIVITEILTDWMVTPWGRFLPREYVYHFAGFLTAVLFIYLSIKMLRGKERKRTFVFWIYVLVSILLSYRYLITVPIEIIHFPQYAILALLLAKSLDRVKDEFLIVRVLLIGTFLGIIDETYQYMYLTKTSSHYLDFNDFLLNQIGVAIGIMIYYGFLELHEMKENVRKLRLSMKKLILSLLAFTFIFFLLSDRIYFRTDKEIEPGGFTAKEGKTVFSLERKPDKYGKWIEDDKGTGYFYVLDPIQGLLLLILWGLVFASYDIRFYKSIIEIEVKNKVP